MASPSQGLLLYFALPFPVIDPVLIEVGPLAIRWYALAYIAGVALGWWVAQRLVKHRELFGGTVPLKESDLDDFLVWAMLGIVIGGRLGFVLFYNLPHYAQHPLQILQVWNGGMSFHGGMAGLILAAWTFARRHKIGFLTLMDIAAAVAPLGLFFGRIANFVNGELYGRTSDAAWAVMFPRGGYVPRHPSQLYEAALEGVLLLIVLKIAIWRFKTLRRPGVTGALFLAGYGCARFAVEFFREPDVQLGYLWGGATMGQLLSLPMIIVGTGYLIYVARRQAGAS